MIAKKLLFLFSVPIHGLLHMLHISGCSDGVSFQLDFPSVCRSDAFLFISDDKHKSGTGNQGHLADLNVAIRCRL